MKFLLTRAMALVAVCILILLTFSRVSLAMSLDSIKDSRVLINLDGNAVKPGDTILVSDTSGKRRAFVKVAQVKGNRALGNIVKGKLTMSPSSYVLQPHESGSSASRGPRSSPPSAWGVAFGYAQNKMSVNAPSVDMTGSGYNVEGFYERLIDGSVSMLTRFAYQTFKVAGTAATAACVNSINCSVDLSYLGLDGLVKYSFFTPKITYWLGAGLGFSFPMSKSSNVIDVSKISVSQKILGDVGLNWYLNRKTYIPVGFEYAMFPSSGGVSSSQIILRVGYGQTF
jgi:hypothetical protein